MRLIIKKAETLQDYVMLEFRGEFQSDGTSRETVTLGSLFPLGGDKYMLQIGIIDLVGTLQPVPQPFAITSVQTANAEQKHVVVLGYARNKILFDKRPIPIMERATKETFPEGHMALFARK